MSNCTEQCYGVHDLEGNFIIRRYILPILCRIVVPLIHVSEQELEAITPSHSPGNNNSMCMNDD